MPKRRATKSEIKEIQRLRKWGEPIQMIAQKIGVSTFTVQYHTMNLKQKRTHWKNVCLASIRYQLRNGRISVKDINRAIKEAKEKGVRGGEQNGLEREFK